MFAPTPLLTITIETEAGEPQMHLHVGGQGAWIARMVRTLGAHVHYCGPFGGETGAVARSLCDAEDFTVHEVPSAAWNGAYVHDRRSGERVELAAVSSAPLTRHELDDLYSTTLSVALESGACIVAGAHSPDAVPDDAFLRLAADVRSAGVPVVVDLSGSSLANVLGGSPSTLKISDEELEQGGWAQGRSREHVLEGIERLREKGANDVVVSRGPEPTIAMMDDRLYQVRAPEVGVVDSSGGGDAMTAALGVAAAWQLGVEDALCLAAAAATATMTRHGLGTGRAELITATAPHVDVEPLD